MSSTAIVIGGSIAGLLTAKVLSHHFDEVMIIERDAYADAPAFRSGTPQSRHGHGLLSAGLQGILQIFPEIHNDLDQSDLEKIKWGVETPLLTASGWLRRVDIQLETYAVSRQYLEWLIRKQVCQTPNIHIHSNTLCVGLVTNSQKTTAIGVKLQPGDGGETRIINGDLIIDTSGRSSKVPGWIKEIGYPTPDETVVNAYLGYATRWYKQPEGFNADWKILAIHPQPAVKNYRAGFILPIENNQWTVILMGANKDYPPTDDAGFEEFAKSLRSLVFYEAIQKAEPVSPIYGYRHTENRLYHYEKLKQRLENLIVMGDAVCGFNPFYGQGMSVIALEALMLDEMLTQSSLGDGFADKFQKKLYSTIQNAWLMATGADLLYPETEGERPNFAQRLVQKYIDRLGMVLPYDDDLATTYLRVINMLQPPASLMKPKHIWRVFQHSIRETQLAQPPAVFSSSTSKQTAVPQVRKTAV